ncbi:hypothetical protein BDZ89DRAFT_1134183 [Hymenopellis radicata]|nr:hypothetical protein BDZ89DRAFT_1134183 [Hymenopellis radicata]
MFSDSRQFNTAEAGTLILEWATLSKHTGNDTYELAEKSLPNYRPWHSQA